MSENMTYAVEPASRDDAEALAKLIDIAGEGIPTWLWQKSAGADQTPLDIGIERACREEGGFSYRNAMVARHEGQVAGMILGYAIETASDDDPEALPAPIAPFVVLENQSVGTWYINALAVFPGYRGGRIGTGLLQAAEEQATRQGIGRMSIQVYGQNTGAVRLYTRMGYREVSRAPVRHHPCQPYYTGDVLLLMKTLG